MQRLFLLLAFLPFSSHMQAQSLEERSAQIKNALEQNEKQKRGYLEQLEGIKFEMIQRDLDGVGLPTSLPGAAIVRHSAYALEYNEEHEQARWVAHIILPDVLSGQVSRSNDFRIDPAVPTGSAIEADYLLKYLQPDSTFKYDGFGWDRGHLAPSADFRWSAKALSESYLYSNMSPQKAEFNRGAWGQLEDRVRGYLYRFPKTQLYVVTGPVLEADLPVIERGINKVSIPRYFYKLVLDLNNQKAIGFLMPNTEIKYPLATYAVPINKVEELTGIDFFPKLPDALEEALESQCSKDDWLPEVTGGDIEPLYPPDLAPNHFNTVQAQNLVGRPQICYVCGTVVGARTSRAGNILLNLDKQFPNQSFTVFIKKENIANFSYNPEQYLKGKVICAKGKVIDMDGTPAMYIETEKGIE